MREQLQIRVHGHTALPTLIYLPGLHGDWTLVTSFRKCVEGKVRFVEFTYPRTLTWSIQEYAQAIEDALAQHGISHGWLLGESFGSQVLWALVGLEASRFRPEGLILAGGFVRHPMQWGVRLARRWGGRVSLTWLTRVLFWYAKFARVRHRNAQESLASIDEFIARRTELDRDAAVHRMNLIVEHDLRPIAQATTLPVFALMGFWEPVVPWPPVFRWLRRRCPGLRGTRVIFRADHNVLGTAPREAAEQILDWMESAGAKRK